MVRVLSILIALLFVACSSDNASVVLSDVSQPDARHADANKSDVMQFDVQESDGQQSDTLPVDASSPDVSQDTSVSDTTLTDTSITDTPSGDAPGSDTGAECTPACGSGMVCDKGKCVCDPTLPTGWPKSLTPLSYPVVTPTRGTAMHGKDNIYAPDIHEVSGLRVMWYGAQGHDGHDRIFVAWSTNGAQWRKYPSDDNPKPVLDRGTSNHVNDPSLVRVGSVWRMYYTDAPTDINDRIWLAESSTFTGFKKVREVLGPGAPGAWDSDKVGRPSVLVEGSVYKMWYDGASSGGRHIGLATSTDGVNFVRHPANPLFHHAGAIDVAKIGGVYVMVRESQDGTYWATSVDGVCWVDRGKLFGLSGAAYDAFGQVTPFLEVSGGALRAVWFGGAPAVSWDRNRIGAAYAPGAAPAGAGCTACTPAGLSCPAACQQAGAGATGSCGNPGSNSQGSCCACSTEGCEGCIIAGADCHQACVNIGSIGGTCLYPGSTNPSACCGCL